MVDVEQNCSPSQMYDDDRWQMRSYVTDEYAISAIKSTLFHRLLKTKSTSVYDDQHMWELLKKIFPNRDFDLKYITFRNIRKIPDWEKKCDDILNEVVIFHKPLGSSRAFRTFKFHYLYTDYVIRITREIWAQHIIRKHLAPLWINYYYNPENGIGFLKIKEHFERVANK